MRIVRIDEWIKPLAVMFFVGNKALFLRGGRNARGIQNDALGIVNENVDAIRLDVHDYVDVIRPVLLRLGGKKTTAACPGFESIHLQSERGNLVLGYWQDRPQETRSKVVYNCKGSPSKAERERGRRGGRTRSVKLHVVPV